MSRSILLATCASALLAAACGGSISGGTPGGAGAPGTVPNDGGVPADSGVTIDSGVPGAGNCPAAPAVVAANQDYPEAVAADNQYVYWTVTIPTDAGAPGTGMIGEVLRAPVDTCNVTPSIFAKTSEATGLALDADRVFWCDADGVMSRPKAGGSTTLLAPGGSGICPLFADSTDLFFTAQTGGGNAGITSLEKLDLASHKTSVLYGGSGYIEGIAANAQSVFFTSSSGPAGVNVGNSVWRVPRAGGNASAIATGQLAPSGIAVDATDVYWVDAGNSGVDIWTGGGSLMREPLAGGAPAALAGNLVGPTSLAIDAKDAFIAGYPIETEQIPLLRVPLAGGTPVKLVPVLSGAADGPGVAVNDTAVYYVTKDSVKRVAKSYSP